MAIHTVSCISRYDNLHIMFKMWTISFDISDRTRDARILRVIQFNEPVKCLFHCGYIQAPSEQLRCSWPKQLACLLHNRMQHELNKTHVCARITLELHACIVNLCPTKNAVNGYPTGINQEHAKIYRGKFRQNLHTLPRCTCKHEDSLLKRILSESANRNA